MTVFQYPRKKISLHSRVSLLFPVCSLIDITRMDRGWKMQRERCCDLCENANMSVWDPSSYSFLSSHKTLYPASRQVFSLFITPSLILWIALITEKSLFTWLSVQMPKDTTSTATRLIIMWRISAFCCCNTLYLSSCLPANIMNTAPLLGGNTIVIVFNSCYKLSRTDISFILNLSMH